MEEKESNLLEKNKLKTDTGQDTSYVSLFERK